MVDYTGHGALVLLILTLMARPISQHWSGLLRYRRALGVGAFILSLVHLTYMMEHTFVWNLAGVGFMLPLQQSGLWAGVAAILCMLPAALTSTDAMVQRLGQAWYTIHRLAVPALLLAAMHAILNGSSYLGGLTLTPSQTWHTVGLSSVVAVVFLVRSRWIGQWFGGDYGTAKK
jgi:DMSO/TMAO reductase YedYZ heme-binding membrane subunit